MNRDVRNGDRPTKTAAVSRLSSHHCPCTRSSSSSSSPHSSLSYAANVCGQKNTGREKSQEAPQRRGRGAQGRQKDGHPRKAVEAIP